MRRHMQNFLASSLREASKLAVEKKAAAAKTSSFGLLALQEKLSFRHWSMMDATPTEIKLLVADVVAYKWNVASRMIAKFWRRYTMAYIVMVYIVVAHGCQVLAQVCLAYQS